MLAKYDAGKREYWDLSICVNGADAYKGLQGCDVKGLRSKVCNGKTYVLATEKDRRYTEFHGRVILNNHIRVCKQPFSLQPFPLVTWLHCKGEGFIESSVGRRVNFRQRHVGRLLLPQHLRGARRNTRMMDLRRRW